MTSAPEPITRGDKFVVIMQVIGDGPDQHRYHLVTVKSADGTHSVSFRVPEEALRMGSAIRRSKAPT